MAAGAQLGTLDEQLGVILLRGQHAVLEMAAGVITLSRVLETLCLNVEEACPGTLCSVLLLTEDGLHLRHGAAPTLSPEYVSAIDGIAIGPDLGSCGAAAYSRESVIAEDVATDRHWRGFAKVAQAAGLASCASTPMLSPDARLLGTFAIYHRTPGPYAPLELQVLRSISDLAAIAVLNHAREETLRESEARRARMAAASAVIETGVSLDGRILVAPPALCALLGRTQEELLALRLTDLVHPGDMEVEQDRFQRVLRGDLERLETESRLLRKDGLPVWTALSCYPVHTAGERPNRLALYVTDISEKRRAEETLRTAQRMQGLSMLAPGLAHDVNNLLTTILCNSGLALAQMDREPVVRESLETIDATVRRAAELTRQMLAHAQNGRARKPVDVNQLATELAHTLFASFSKRIAVELDLSPGLPSVLGDASRIHQVAMNLMINAAQAIGEHEGVIHVRTSVVDLRDDELRTRFAGQGLTPGEHVLLEVSDTGSGIEPGLLPRIFDPYFTTKEAGQGIGLAVSQGIVRDHGGAIEVFSERGRGSSFRVLFPALRLRAVPASTRRAEEGWPVARGAVLVVDDDSWLRGAIARTLVALGFEAVEATDGQSALLQLAKRRREIALVIFDVTSPRPDDREAFLVLRERWPDLKVILTTGGDELDLDVSSGHVRLLSKPYGLLDLKRAISDDTDAAVGEVRAGEGTPRSA